MKGTTGVVVGRREVEARIEAVRKAKLNARLVHDRANLDPAELDAALAPERPRKAFGGRKPRTDVVVLPCALCGDPAGRPHHGGSSPARPPGERFGIAGKLCLTCYVRLDARVRNAGKVRRPRVHLDFRRRRPS
jgi:hypothetical protein